MEQPNPTWRRFLPRSTAARLSALVSLGLGVALLAAMAWKIHGGPTGEPLQLSDATIGAPFSLIDQQGNRRVDGDFRGRLMLVFFGFTHCPDICPAELQTMSAALDDLGVEAERVTPIFITVDPARDTVAAMRDYAANFHPRLVALTGTEAEIAAVAKAYRAYYRKAAGDNSGNGDVYLMEHSSIIYLMGADGRFLTHIRAGGSPGDMAAIIRDNL